MHDINLCEAKFTAGLKGSFASISSSPRQKTPKKAVQAMAQRTTFLGFDEVSRILIWESTGVVMGSLILGGVSRISLAWQIPASTLFRMGREECSLGSGRPSEICILRTAKRYNIPVWGVRPFSQKCYKAAKMFSDWKRVHNRILYKELM